MPTGKSPTVLDGIGGFFRLLAPEHPLRIHGTVAGVKGHGDLGTLVNFAVGDAAIEGAAGDLSIPATAGDITVKNAALDGSVITINIPVKGAAGEGAAVASEVYISVDHGVRGREGGPAAPKAQLTVDRSFAGEGHDGIAVNIDRAAGDGLAGDVVGHRVVDVVLCGQGNAVAQLNVGFRRILQSGNQLRSGGNRVGNAEEPVEVQEIIVPLDIAHPVFMTLNIGGAEIPLTVIGLHGLQRLRRRVVHRDRPAVAGKADVPGQQHRRVEGQLELVQLSGGVFLTLVLYGPEAVRLPRLICRQIRDLRHAGQVLGKEHAPTRGHSFIYGRGVQRAQNRGVFQRLVSGDSHLGIGGDSGFRLASLLRQYCAASFVRQHRSWQQRQAQAQSRQNAQKSFLHRDPSIMKVIWFLQRRNQGDIPLPKIYFSVRASKPFSACWTVFWMMPKAIV